MNTSTLPLSKRLSLLRKDMRAAVPNPRPRVECDPSLMPGTKPRRAIKAAALCVFGFCVGWLTSSFLISLGVL